MDPMTRVDTLPNGLRLAVTPMPHMESVAVGLWTEAGSRHESTAEHGMAHFVEHLVFKGTPTRDAETISREIEGLGASVDAFTVEDHTAYHAKGPADQFAPLFGAMADFYRNPVFDPADIESERQVIGEEIAMVRDQPSQWLEDVASEAAWGAEHPLGRSITGTEESLASFRRGDVVGFFQRAYSAANTVVSVAGRIDAEEVIALVGETFGDAEKGARVEAEAAPDFRTGIRFEKAEDQEQDQISLAFPGVHRHDPDRFAWKLLNTILGENMSSRLFQEVREKRALCYEVQSDLVSFADAGLTQIYLALSPGHVGEALEAIASIGESLARDGVTEAELAAAKSYLVGQSRVSLENTSSRMMWSGECLLFFGSMRDPEEVHQAIFEVTPEEVKAAAQKMFDPFLFSAALIGAEKSAERLERWRTAVG